MSVAALQLDHGRARIARRPSPADELRDLARQVLRIHDPYRANPEATLIAKNTIAVRLRQLANSIEVAMDRRDPQIDFARINSAALGALPSLLSRWLPDGRREGHEWVARNPRRADRSLGSFRINMTSGKWADFATDDRGGDVVSLAAYLAGTGQAEAARNLADMLGGAMMHGNAMFAPLSPEEAATTTDAPKAASKTPIVPVPADATPFAFKHPKLGEPSRSWPYHDGEGRLVGYVCRWDFTDAEGAPTKDILPVTYCDLGNGKRGWRSKGMPAPRPLFGLPDILARADATVLIAEGEKARDAAAVLFPDMVATTPAHGAKSPHLTDFASLSGRTVVIATDFDEPGRVNDKGKPLHPGQDFGDKVCELARAAGARVLHLHPDRLGAWLWRDGEKVLRGEPMKDGWDLADALAEGWTAEAVAELHSDPAFLPPYMDAEERKAARSMLGDDDAPEQEAFEGWPFRLAWNGVEKRIERADKETGMITVEWRWFCSLLEVDAETRSSEGEEWGRLLRVTDRDKRVKDWAMPMAMLAGDGTAYRERLLSLGLIMAPGKFARDALHEYISTAHPEVKARCVSRIGWQSKVYVRFNGNFGEHAHG